MTRFQGKPARGGEPIRTFFDFSGADGQEKAQRPVRRFELMAILDQYHRASASRRLHRRLWRWLTTRQSWSLTDTPAPTKAAAERAGPKPA